MLKKFLLVPAVLGIISGMVSAALFIHFVSKALVPDLVGTVAIYFVGFLLGLSVSAAVGFAAVLVEMKTAMDKLKQNNCFHCSGRIPASATFCPHCGRRSDLVAPLAGSL